MSIAQLAWATPKLVLEKYQTGTNIVSEGEPADRFYIITKGEAQVLRKQPDGKELLINHLKTGQYFGEIGLLRGTGRSATVRALTPTEVLCLERKDFAALIANSEASRVEMEYLVEERVNQLRAVQNHA